MHSPKAINVPVYSDATKPMRRISNYMRSHVIGRCPSNTRESDVIFLSGWHCFLGHIKEELSPDLGNEYLSSVMHHPLARKLPTYDANELILETVESLEEDEGFFETVSDAAEDCLGIFSRTYPSRELEEIAHIRFDPKARTMEFQLAE